MTLPRFLLWDVWDVLSYFLKFEFVFRYLPVSNLQLSFLVFILGVYLST